MESTTSLWNKPANDLTVGDNVKITLASIGALVGTGVVIVTVSAVAEKFRSFRSSRKTETPESE